MANLENEVFKDDELNPLVLIVYGILRRIFERTNYFENLDELSFYRRFRLTKRTTERVLQLIRHHLEYQYNL